MRARSRAGVDPASRGIVAVAVVLCGTFSTPPTAFAASPGANGRIAFSNGAKIKTVTPSGRKVKQLIPGHEPTYSPDGSRIAFEGIGDPGIRLDVIDSDGSNVQHVVTSGQGAIGGFGPSFSPDSSRLIYNVYEGHFDGNEFVTTLNGLVTSDLNGSNREVLTNNAPSDCITNEDPVYSPDGDHIAFTRRDNCGFPSEPDPYPTDIYLMDSDGSDVTNLTSSPNQFEGSPDFSPDGQRIVFESSDWRNHPTIENRIEVMDVDGGNREILIGSQSPLGALGPSVSPDGRWVAYNDIEKGLRAFRIDDPETTAQYEIGLDGAPSWGPKPTTLDWKMADRFWLDRNRDDLIDYPRSPGDISPDQWQVNVRLRKNGRDCKASSNYRFFADGAQLPREKKGPCRYRIFFPSEAEGESFYVEARVREEGEFLPYAADDVTVEDWLIVSLGDSVASGEGNPDVPSLVRRAKWQKRRCHRSAWAGPARAAQRLELKEDHSSVTFVHLACSGGQVEGIQPDGGGILSPFRGREMKPGEDKDAPCDPKLPQPPCLAPQVDEAAHLVGNREIDATLLGVGANDAYFGPTTAFCIVVEDCPDKHFNPRQALDGECVPGAEVEICTALAELTAERLALLANRYEKLNAGLVALMGPGSQSRVYPTEYFDPTRDADGRYCNALPDDSFGGPLLEIARIFKRADGFKRKELRWAHDNFLVPLNQALDVASVAYGWSFVGGVKEAYREHGFCAGRDRWVVTTRDSYINLGTSGLKFKDAVDVRLAGMFHPNRAGHRATGKLIFNEVWPDLEERLEDTR